MTTNTPSSQSLHCVDDQRRLIERREDVDQHIDFLPALRSNRRKLLFGRSPQLASGLKYGNALQRSPGGGDFVRSSNAQVF